MSEIRARVQVGANYHMFPMEVVNPHKEIGEAMIIAERLGGAALEVAQVELLESSRWKRATSAEALPTMFDL